MLILRFSNVPERAMDARILVLGLLAASLANVVCLCALF